MSERQERERREHGQTSIEEAKKMGMNFGGGPPKFKNERKKAQDLVPETE